MARKKHKAKSPPVSRSVPPAETGGRSAWALPALGWLALVLAWLAALGGFSDGTGHIRAFMEGDHFRMLLLFRELFVYDAPLASLREGPAPYYFPDMALQWALFAPGAGVALTLCVYPLAQTALSAVGWVLLCDRLFGKSPARRAVVPMLHALPFLFLAWGNADIFFSQMSGVFHHSVVAALPWLLWLSLLILDPAPKGKQSAAPPVRPATALLVLLALMSASDMLVVPQFVAPAGLCALILAWRGRLSWRGVSMFFALMAAGVVGGRVLGQVPDIVTWEVSPDSSVQSVLRSLRLQGAHFGYAALRNPLAASAWLVFAAIGSWRALAVLRPNLRRTLFAPIAVPSGFGHSLLALFVPAAVASSFLAPAAAGLGQDGFSYLLPNPPFYQGVMVSVRYSLPVIFLPLFVGWALLPGGFQSSGRAGGLALAVGAALAAVSAPKAARIDFAALDPLATPFQKCVAENARRLEWRGGVMTESMKSLPLLHPDADIERLLPVGVFRRPEAGESFMVVEKSFVYRPVNGEFDFVVVNLYKGRYFPHPPLAGEAGCEVNNQESCIRTVNNYDLDADSVRAAFGEPKEEINCEGVGLFHYDPPLRFDFSARDDPYLAPVARW